jgi:hypothetical protein
VTENAPELAFSVAECLFTDGAGAGDLGLGRGTRKRHKARRSSAGALLNYLTGHPPRDKCIVVNGYSQVYGRVFSHNPWDADRLLENVNAIYDDLISGVPEGDGKKLTDQKVVEKYGNLLPSGMKAGSTFTTYFKHQASASIKRGRYVQLCKERKTEVKEAKQEAAARKRAAKQNAGAGKKKRKVAKPQPGPSLCAAENALEVEDLFTDMTDGAGAGGADVLGLADWLGREFASW